MDAPSRLVPASSHFRKWLVLLGSILLQISLGSMFAFGNFSPYLASYLTVFDYSSSNQSDDDDAFSTTYKYYLSQCNWIFASCYIAFTISSIMGGHIQQQIGIKATLILSTLLMTIGTLLCYWTIINVYALIFCQLLFGCGAGIAYSIPFISCQHWFKYTSSTTNNDFRIILLLHACFTSSAFIFAPIQFAIINPMNIPLDPNSGFLVERGDSNIIDRIPLAFVYSAVIIFVLQAISILLISNPFITNRASSVHHHVISDNMNSANLPHSCSCGIDVHNQSKYIGYASIFVAEDDDIVNLSYYQMKEIEILLIANLCNFG